MASGISRPDQLPSAPSVGRRASITLRSVLLGTATGILLNIVVNYVGMVLVSGALVKSQLPMAVLMPFVAWLGINLLLRIIWPRIALSSTELLVIYSMSWIVGVIPVSGWTTYWGGIVSAPAYYASPENRWQELLFDVLPWWTLPRSSGGVVHAFYEGLPPGAGIPWRGWIAPLYWWVGVSLAMVVAGLCISVLFQKQWEKAERLTFPLAVFAVALTEGFDGKERIPAIFRNPIFWAGFLVVAGVYVWNTVGYFAPGVPPIGIYDSVRIADKQVMLARDFPPLILRILPPVVGLTYFCSLDVLLSFWVFRLLAILKEGLMARVGFAVGYTGQQAEAREILTLESHGAFVFLALWSIWTARGHLLQVLRAAWKGCGSPGDDGLIAYRLALLGLGISTVYVIGWSVGLGLSLSLALLQVALLYIAYFTVMKYMAASGFSYLFPVGEKGGPILKSMVGTMHLSREDFVALELINSSAFFGNYRIPAWPALPHHLKLFAADRRPGRVFWVAPLAFSTGLLTAFLFVIYLGYSQAAQNLGLAGFQGANEVPYNRMVSEIAISNRTVFDPGKVAVWVVGGLGAGLLTLLRSRWSWWPFHPLGLAFQATGGLRVYAFGMFLTWAFKYMVLRYGGIPLYRRCQPFFLGLIVGYIVGIGISMTVDYIWFPAAGHWTHGW